MGSFCLLQSRLPPPTLPSSSSSSLFWCYPERNVCIKSKKSVRIITLRYANLFYTEKVPRLPFRTRALEGGNDLSSTNGTNKQKQFQSYNPANVFISLLNELQLLWASFVGAIFGFALKEKKAMEAAIESLKTQLEGKERVISSMDKTFKLKLHSEQEKSSRQLREAKQVHESLTSQLELAKDSLEDSREKLEREKNLSQDLKNQVASLDQSSTIAVRDKRELEGLLNEKLEMIKLSNSSITHLNLQIEERERNIQILSSSLSTRDLEVKNLKISCSELESNISRIRSEFSEVHESLRKKSNESERNFEKLAKELASKNEHLEKAREENQVHLNELAVAIQDREDLRTAMQDLCKKLEGIERECEEEREKVASLSKKNQALEMQSLKDKEARRSLENSLDEATKSLEEMNQNALLLSRDLEKATSHVSKLEDEKTVLCRFVEEHENAAEEAQKDVEDAHGMIVRLGEEREGWERRANRLEEDLQLAKGEILRLRSKTRNARGRINNHLVQKAEGEGNPSVFAKKNGAT